MPRSTNEWFGTNDDTPIPPRVQARVFIKYDGVCQICQTKIIDRNWQPDHINALINGGAHRESNLQPVHTGCHKTKTAGDLRTKKVLTKKIYKRLGIKPRKSSRPMVGSKASGWKKTFNHGWVKR